MKIIGHGMIAQSLLPYHDRSSNAVIFASEVANSRTTNEQAYEREYQLLYETLHACTAEGKQIVYFSSAGAIYGETNSPRTETTPLFPTTAYGRHKLLCQSVIANSGANYLIVRLANLVGRAQNASQLVPALVEQIKQGRVTILAQAVRDLLDVDDFAKILLCVLAADLTKQTLLVASGHSIAVAEIVSEFSGYLVLGSIQPAS